MIFICANCGKECNHVLYDKVFRKVVCDSCKNKAVDMGIRFEFDYEELK